jgi:hypothetical protein
MLLEGFLLVRPLPASRRGRSFDVRRPMPEVTGGHESGGCATLGQRKLRPGSGSPRSQVEHCADELGRRSSTIKGLLRDEQSRRTARALAHQSIFEVRERHGNDRTEGEVQPQALAQAPLLYSLR